MKIAFIGIGNVGSALASALVRLGHEVTIAARNLQSDSVQNAQERIPGLAAKPVAEAVSGADLIFLATPFEASEAALKGAGDLSGKTIVDCTNPVAPDLTHGLQNRLSGGEFIQQLVPTAHVVKAFTIYGFENFDNTAYPGYGELKPAMLIAGNDSTAKQSVSALCEELGWEPIDTGDIASSLHLEHMTLLWIKMARVQGMGDGLVWAKLSR